MENKRFSVRVEGVAYIKNADGTIMSGDAIDRLAAYEDTGLAPEDIPTGLEFANVYAAMQELKRYEAIGTVEHLTDMVKAESEGRLVVLPCKVGDTIYVIPSETNRGLNAISHPENNRVYVQTVEAVLWCNNKRYLLRTCTGLYEALSDYFGVTWFLSRQEAEVALEEQNG